MPERIAEQWDQDVCRSDAAPMRDVVDDVVVCISRDVVEISQRSRSAIGIWRLPIGCIYSSRGNEILKVICATRRRQEPICPVRFRRVDAKGQVAWPIIDAIGGLRSFYVSKSGGDVRRRAHGITRTFDRARKNRNCYFQRDYHSTKLHLRMSPFHPLPASAWHSQVSSTNERDLRRSVAPSCRTSGNEAL